MGQDFYSIRSYSQVLEFHNITPIQNIESIVSNGILSYDLASKILHNSVAMNTIQERRDKKIVNGRKLHKYANLYFHARNPMMFKIFNKEICVLRVNKNIGEQSNVVFSDRNASSEYANFYSLRGTNLLDYELIFCKDWRDQNKIYYYEKKSKKCAEILIPEKIDYSYVTGAYVKSEMDKQNIIDKGFRKPIEINKELFFL